jgi:outer membrane protein assembly factor BamA
VLSPINVGYEPLVRGYARESFENRECVPVEQTASPVACPAFDRLLGSRIAVLNFELRIPLFGVSEYGLLNFPMLPLELAPFFDAGLAWSANDEPTLAFKRRTDERVPVFSAGITARVNILGYVVLETYYAYPFQRPDKGGHFGFNLAPGW